jgi:hypothetical protein
VRRSEGHVLGVLVRTGNKDFSGQLIPWSGQNLWLSSMLNRTPDEMGHGVASQFIRKSCFRISLTQFIHHNNWYMKSTVFKEVRRYHRLQSRSHFCPADRDRMILQSIVDHVTDHLVLQTMTDHKVKRKTVSADCTWRSSVL